MIVGLLDMPQNQCLKLWGNIGQVAQYHVQKNENVVLHLSIICIIKCIKDIDSVVDKGLSSNRVTRNILSDSKRITMTLLGCKTVQDVILCCGSLLCQEM